MLRQEVKEYLQDIGRKNDWKRFMRKTAANPMKDYKELKEKNLQIPGLINCDNNF